MSRTGPELTVAVALLVTVAAIGASEPAVAAEADADLGQAWRAWAYSRPIEVGADALEQRLIRVPLPEEIFATAQAGLLDLRVVDDSGKEIGYILRSKLSFGSDGGGTWFHTQLLDTGTVPGGYVQAVAELGNDGEAHDLVVVELVDRGGEFFAWAQIASSPDYETWRVLRAKAPVYHFRETREGQAMRVTYPPTRDRWLRLRLESDHDAHAIADLRVGVNRVEAEAELEPTGLELALEEDSPKDQSWWESHSTRNTAPIAGVRFEVGREEFHRPVKISSSDDGETFREVGRGQIYRFLPQETDIGVVRESVRVEFRPDSARFWRVTVIDGNDAPIEDLRITLLRPVESVVFRPEPGRSFRLLYGNSRAASPKYELAQLVDGEEQDSAPLGALGPKERNPHFVSSEPFSERHPVVMWAALGLAVLLLGVLAVRSLR